MLSLRAEQGRWIEISWEKIPGKGFLGRLSGHRLENGAGNFLSDPTALDKGRRRKGVRIHLLPFEFQNPRIPE